ncbi:CDP-diacylglycerol--glycerol-3-phosphate 3-phosphatidyltransferase [Rhodotorula paludigena]|uniref:CDP-diacylglycerol--glycerol-3-phosphate 3-phosphatidyltransferase n=1 Tax=Rhodotorula paludigena TaxID=86838 RepID=UPI0031742333
MLARLRTPSAWRVVFAARRHYYARAPPLHAEFERHPAFADLSSQLDAAGLPAFATHGKGGVRVLYEPKEFYQTLLDKVRTAQRRIFIASLYVGKEEKELVAALHDALRRNPALRLTLVVDYLRSTREHTGASSAALLASLAAAFPAQVDLRLFHTPALHGWQRRWVPKRFNEGWGLQHMKCYGFDDDVIMSGANLSHDYFTNRADRYIELCNHAPLADFFSSLLELVASYSFRATASDPSSAFPATTLSWPSTNAISSDPFEAPDPAAALSALQQHAHAALSAFVAAYHARPARALAASLPAALTAAPPSVPTTPSSTPPSFPARRPQPALPPAFDTLLRPVLQMGPFALRHETDTVVPAVFQAANALATAPGGARTTLDWTSGYFSLRDDYQKLVLDCKARVRIVSASPEANGFFNSRGVSRFIPPAYTYFSQRFYEAVVEQARRKRLDEPGVEMSEWKRDGWTYHAKGIWLAPSVSNPFSPPTSTSFSPLPASLSFDPQTHDLPLRLQHPSPPFLTLVGSSNFGARSAARDLEAGVLVTTQNTALRWALEKEVRAIHDHARAGVVTAETFERKDRRVPWGVKVAARAIEGML